MRARWQVTGTAVLLVLGCSSDAHIRLLEPRAGNPQSDAGAGASGEGGGGASGSGGGSTVAGAGGRQVPGSGGRGGRDAGGVGGRPVDSGGGMAPDEDAGFAPAGFDALIVRYDFEGTGTDVIDRIGFADARIRGGAMLDGEGGVLLDGMDDYVDMPNGMLSLLTDASIVTWLEWNGDFCWERVFDFGANDHGEGQVGYATSALFVTPAGCNEGRLMSRAEFSSSAYELRSDRPMPIDRLVQVALVFDSEEESFALYMDGQQVAKARAGFQLHWIEDNNNWLGRSQWVQDRNLHGRYEEFRLYAAPLSAEDIASLYDRGPNDP